MPPFVPACYGEPVEFRGDTMYFTSWKYVRQGNWHWQRYNKADANLVDQTDKNHGGDGGVPARFEPRNMPRGIRLRAQKGVKVPLSDPAIRRVNTLIQDGGLYRMWYQNSDGRLCYGESSDCEKWNMPAGPAGAEGGNVVFDGSQARKGLGGGSVFIDPTSTDERFKAFYGARITDEEWEAFARKYPDKVDPMAYRPVNGRHGVVGAVSADGMNWRTLSEPLLLQHADTQNTCYYDIDRRQYVAYVRSWQVDGRQPGLEEKYGETWIYVGRRSIGRCVSDDFRHFSKAELVVTPGADMAPSHLWYNNCKTTLPGCPNQHVMFPWRWEMERDGGDTFLMSSAEGWTWSVVPGGPVVECGPIGDSDGEYLMCNPNLVELPTGRWAVPYWGQPIPHKYPGRGVESRTGLLPGVQDAVGLVSWEKGRLVALEADEGEFSTLAVVPPGKRLRLNAAVRASGFIRVEVFAMGQGNVPGRSFADCDDVIGNGYELPVTWGGQEDINTGDAAVMLRFRMRFAKLFSVRFV